MTFPQTPPRYHKLTIAQLIISLFGMVYTLMAGAGIFYLVQISHQMPASFGQLDTSQLVPIYWLLGFCLLLTIPSIVLSIRELQGKPVFFAISNRSRFLRASVLLVLWVPALYLGIEMSKTTAGRLFLPLVSILLVILPLMWFLELGRRNLPVASVKRFWGIVNGSIFFTMPLIFVVEAFFLGIGLLWLGSWIFEQPNMLPLLKELSTFSTPSPSDLAPILERLQALLTAPQITFGLILGFSIVVPLVEELLKPLVLWFFVRRNLTPAEGFTIGLICGAAFALVESFSAITSVDQTLFLSTAAGRTGTGLLHLFNSGMIGWAIASTWQDGKYLRVILTYLGAAALHGLWNFFALLFGFGNAGFALPALPASLVQAAPWMLGLMGVWMLTILFVMNQRLQKQSLPPRLPMQMTPPPLPSENGE